MKKSLIFGTVLLALFFTACTQEEKTQMTTSESPITFEETEFDFGIVKQSGGIVSHDFVFTYSGKEARSITSTPGSCACTKGSTEIIELSDGVQGVLTVSFNPNLHAEPEGKFFKTVAVLTDPPLPITPEVKIWAEIDLDLGENAFELQAPHEEDEEHVMQTLSTVAHDGATSGFNNTNEFTITAKEVIAELDEGMDYEYWTFDGTVPGPFMRVKEGDQVTIHFANDSSSKNMHSIDLHAVNGLGGGADVTQVYPGEKKSFTFKALNPGVYVYHCASPNIPEHVANGMYGLIIVEPKEGLPPVDKEYYLTQGEFYPLLSRKEKGLTRLSGDKMMNEQPEYVVFNGKVGALVGKRALTATVGDRIRMFVGNAGIAKPSHFHIIGEIFDTVYPEGGTPVQHNIQTTLLPAGGATIVEFVVDVPGTYKIVDHALARLDKGAYGELIVTGKEN